MESLFLKILNMSIAASWLVFAIFILRLLLKRAPKAFVCMLWVFVAIRLIFPISFESELSLIPSVETVPTEITNTETPRLDTGFDAINRVINPVISESFGKGNDNKPIDIAPASKTEAGASSNSVVNTKPVVDVDVKEDNRSFLQELVDVGTNVWCFGIILMLFYALISYIRIHGIVREAVAYKDNIWLCDRIETAFILGILKPRIILPSDMKSKDVDYVLAHEQAHLKRFDHIWKPLGFILLTIYWFNPILWGAYILLCRDIEMACDEKVIKGMNAYDKKAYTTALLDYSISRKMISACPLAFGESGVESRIKSVLSYKKPTFWIIIVALIVLTGVAIGFLTNPKSEKNTDIEKEQTEDNGIKQNDNNTTYQNNENEAEVNIESIKKVLLDGGYYEYPDTEGMDGNTIVDKCRIPKEILDIMTTEQLAKAVIEYPMLWIHFASSQAFGTAMLQNACDAYRELLTREDAKDVLITQVKLNEVNVASYVEIEFLKDIILAETKFANILTAEDKDYLNSYEPDAKLLGYYEYPDVNFIEENAGINMCKISKEVVENLTTEQLAQAVFEYPYIYQVAEAVKYPDSEYYSSDMSDAYNEILTREDAEYELFRKVTKYDGVIGLEYKVQAIKEILLFESKLNGNWTEEENEYLKNMQSQEKISNGISFKTLLVDISPVYVEKFKEEAINNESVGDGIEWIYPMHMFNTKKELVDFYNEYGDFGDGLSSLHPKFSEIQNKYDEDFFEENTLFIVYTYTGSYMIEEDVESIYVDDKQFSVYIDVSKDPGAVDYGGGDYFILIEVDKDDIKGCIEFGAYNYPIEE